MDQPLLSLDHEKTRKLTNLIEKSHESHMDLNDVLDWARGADRSIMPKRADHSWIYGTPYWDALTEEQRVELLWLEVAMTASMFIWLEEGLSPLFIGLLHRNRKQMPAPIYEYMMVFCKEELVHTQMFRRFLKLAKLPVYERPEVMGFIDKLVEMHPVAGVLCTYLAEGIAEETAMRQDGPGIDPLAHQLFFEHHREELRHLAFGRWICESFFAEVGAQTKGQIGFLVRAFMSTNVPLFTYNPEISRYLSFDIGIDPNDAETIDRIRRSPNNERLNNERYGPTLEWIKQLGLAPANYQWLDPVQPMPF
jgi:hypothetical protein